MTKKLTKHGNSLAIIIDKPILKLLGINEKTKLEIAVKNGSLIITPASKRSMKDRDIEQIADEIMDKYAEVFKKLAK